MNYDLGIIVRIEIDRMMEQFLQVAETNYRLMEDYLEMKVDSRLKAKLTLLNIHDNLRLTDCFYHIFARFEVL